MPESDHTTILFGNGLGMALDPTHFALPSGLAAAWASNGALEDVDRRRVVRCTGTDDASTPPTDESDLLDLHRVVTACDLLNHVADGNVGWLAEDARGFPDSVRKFIAETAAHFFCFEGNLPDPFLDSLADFIRVNRAHVATLNYDNLLYRPFVDRGLCAGFDGDLVDGFLSEGFSADNLDRKFGKDFGWYMHLHGSPLFQTSDSGLIAKVSPDAIRFFGPGASQHIVLTHFAVKAEVISGSALLSAYWERLADALKESSRIVLFGYSGLDVHVNRAVTRRCRGSEPPRIDVVEWEGAGEESKRSAYWWSCFHAPVELHRMADVLAFDWSAAL